MAIPSYDFITQPYDDQYLVYDYDKHQYILNFDYEYVGILLVEKHGSEEFSRFVLNWISDVCYEYIKTYKDSKYYNKLMYYLSHSKQARDVIFKVMYNTVKYNVVEGGMFESYATGTNLQETKMIDIPLETAIGKNGVMILKNGGLAERIFKYDFTYIPPNTNGKDW